MVGSVTIEIKHAVYDTYNYQRGANLDVDAGALNDLLVESDNALERSTGGFFETIEETFVFGTEEPTGEATPRDGEAYFDVFTMPVDHVEQADILDLTSKLLHNRVDSYIQEPRSSFTLQVNPQTQYSVESTDYPNNPYMEVNSVEPMFIAEMWEQLRRESVQCSATDDEVNRFVSVVDGAIRELNYIRPLRRESDYFDISGDKELEMRFEPESLKQTVVDLRSNGKLEFDNLPTYREELENLRRHNRSQIAESREIQEAINGEIQSFYDQIESEANQYTQYAAKLMRQAENGELSELGNTDNGITKKVTNLVSKGGGKELQMLNPEIYNSLDPEVVEAIDTKLDEERQRIREKITQELLEELEKSVVKEFDDRSERIAMEVMQKMEEVNRSEVAKRAGANN